MKKKTCLLLSVLLLSFCSCNKDYLHDLFHHEDDGEGTPPPVPQFNKVYGGTKDDNAKAIAKTSDGGYIMAGSTYSNDGDVTGNHGASDA